MSSPRHAAVVVRASAVPILTLTGRHPPAEMGQMEESFTMRRRLLLAVTGSLLAVAALAGPAGARDFGTIYANDLTYRVFGNSANVPDGTGTDPFATFTNSTNGAQRGVAAFAPGSPTGHHGGRWAVYRATWTAAGDPTELVTSWSELEARVTAGEILLVRDAAADFRCPVLGNPSPID